MSESAPTLLYYKAVSEILDLVVHFQCGECSDRPFNDRESTMLTTIIDKLNLLDQHFESRAQAQAHAQILNSARTLDQVDSIKRCMDYVTLLASLNFTKKLDVRTEDDSEIAALGTGLNMLAEELQYSTVSRVQLLEERDLANSVIETAPTIVLILDHEGKIIRLNPYMEHLCGYKLTDVLYSDWITTLIPEHDRERVKALFQQALQGEPLVDNVHNIQSIDNKEIPIEWHNKIMKDRRGQVSGLLCIGIDISSRIKNEKERHDLQLQLQHSEKLASIGTLAAGVAHEINNPLSIVKGYVGMLANRLIAADPHEDDEVMFVHINESINRIATIVGGLRTFARADNDNLDALDINKTIREVIPFIQEITRSTAIEIRQKLAADEPLIRANYGKIQQVLINLLTNACDALESRADDRLIVIETLSDGEYVTIRFSDNGSGIPGDMLSKIFNPFFTTKPPGKGTGLGLSITHAIIESFGGSLYVTSHEGEGSTFHIMLPRLYQQAQPKSGDSHGSKMRSMPKLKGEILIVDDEPGLCDIFKNYLTEVGLSVTTMHSAVAALEMMGDVKFDIIITDMQMPGLSGSNLIRKARELDLQTGARFIVITGGIITSYSEADRDFLRESVQGYLVKPFEQDQLLTLVKSLLPPH